MHLSCSNCHCTQCFTLQENNCSIKDLILNVIAITSSRQRYGGNLPPGQKKTINTIGEAQMSQEKKKTPWQHAHFAVRRFNNLAAQTKESVLGCHEAGCHEAGCCRPFSRNQSNSQNTIFPWHSALDFLNTFESLVLSLNAQIYSHSKISILEC